MPLKSSDPERHAPANPRLRAAIERLHEQPGRQRRAELLECLMSGPVLLAIHELPDPFDCSETEDALVRFVAADWEDAGRVVCAFSGPAALAAQLPAAIGLSLDPASVLDWIVASGARGLLLDPADAPVLVTDDDAREMLGLPRRKDRGGRATSPRATVREPRTGKAVCFERVDAGGVRMVLTATSLAEDERARATMLFQELAGGLDDLPAPEADEAATPSATDYQALFCGDAARPARAGMKVFTWVFGFPPSLALEIDIA
jgi:hypothetical protein